MKTNKLKNLLMTSVFVVGILISSVAYAQTQNLDDIKTQIQLLKQERAELRVQIESGEITKEVAISLLQPKIDVLKELKNSYFESKIKSINEKISVVAEKNPERAEMLSQFITNLSNNRNIMKDERLKLHNAIKAGEISREDAQVSRANIHQSFKNEGLEIRNTLKANRESLEQNRLLNKEGQNILKREKINFQGDRALKNRATTGLQIQE